MKRFIVNEKCNSCGECIVGYDFFSEDSDGRAVPKLEKYIHDDELGVAQELVDLCPVGALSIAETKTIVSGVENINKLCTYLRERIEEIEIPEVYPSDIDFDPDEYEISLGNDTNEGEYIYPSKAKALSAGKAAFEELFWFHRQDAVLNVLAQYKMRHIKPYYEFDDDSSFYKKIGKEVEAILKEIKGAAMAITQDQIVLPERFTLFEPQADADFRKEAKRHLDEIDSISYVNIFLEAFERTKKKRDYTDGIRTTENVVVVGKDWLGANKIKTTYGYRDVNYVGERLLHDILYGLCLASNRHHVANIDQLAADSINYISSRYQKLVKNEIEKKIKIIEAAILNLNEKSGSIQAPPVANDSIPMPKEISDQIASVVIKSILAGEIDPDLITENYYVREVVETEEYDDEDEYEAEEYTCYYRGSIRTGEEKDITSCISPTYTCEFQMISDDDIGIYDVDEDDSDYYPSSSEVINLESCSGSNYAGLKGFNCFSSEYVIYYEDDDLGSYEIWPREKEARPLGMSAEWQAWYDKQRKLSKKLTVSEYDDDGQSHSKLLIDGDFLCEDITELLDCCTIDKKDFYFVVESGPWALRLAHLNLESEQFELVADLDNRPSSLVSGENYIYSFCALSASVSYIDAIDLQSKTKRRIVDEEYTIAAGYKNKYIPFVKNRDNQVYAIEIETSKLIVVPFKFTDFNHIIRNMLGGTWKRTFFIIGSTLFLSNDGENRCPGSRIAYKVNLAADDIALEKMLY